MLHSAHDCAEGGLGVTLAESAIAGDLGALIALPEGLPAHIALFSESASRAVITCASADRQRILDAARALNVPAFVAGVVQGDSLVVGDTLDLSVQALRDAWSGALHSTLGRDHS
ncbi:MAG: hypothetical protein NVSMB57_02440 [Actinomycetota bacterium]